MNIKKGIFTSIILIAVLLLSSCFSNKYQVELFLDHIGGEDPFNQPAVDGLNSSISMYSVSGIVREATNDNSFSKIFSSISSSSDLVICLGYKTMDYAVEAAEKYPNINFVAIDCAYDTDYKNLVGISYRVQESSFLVGYIAGMTTKTDKLGFVGGMETDNIYAFDYGFRAGALYAASQLDKTIEVESVYINDFANSELGKSAAENLYNNGCDVVFHAAGASGLGVIEAAKEMDKYVIGVDVDQSYLAPQNVLTSALKDIKTSVILTISEYRNNEVYRGGTKFLGLYEGAVGIPDQNPLVEKNVLQRTQELKELIINGDIVPPETEQQLLEFSKDYK